MSSRLRGFNGVERYIIYLKNEISKTGANFGKRVCYEYSTLIADTDDIKGMVAELKLSSGRAYEGNELRISFHPDDRKLSEQEFRDFTDRVCSLVIPDR